MTAGYWEREGLERAILGALAAAGRDVDALTVDALAPADHFHGGGKAATDRLARLAGIRPGMHVLDVGGGLGGPARTLATYGAHVTVVDVTESFVRTGAALTARLGLADRVEHRVGDALALDVPAASFDLVWTQNSGMSIPDKERLYVGFARALRPGGVLATQEPMAGPVQPVIFPVMWARDAAWRGQQADIERAQAEFHAEDETRARSERGALQAQLDGTRAQLEPMEAEIRRLDAELADLRRQVDAGRADLVAQHNGLAGRRSALAEEYNRLVADANGLIDALNWAR